MTDLSVVRSARPATVDDDVPADVLALPWRLSSHGYVYYWAGRNVYLHRLLTGAGPGQLVDHKNGDALDNRRANLRVCRHRDNLRNQRVQQRAKSSRHKGVYRASTCEGWVAQVRVNGRAEALGRFASEDFAARVYDTAARERFGEFARLNFPDLPPLTPEEKAAGRLPDRRRRHAAA